MTLRVRKKVATALKKIVRVEFPRATWSRGHFAEGLRRLCGQAQKMGLQPEDVLTGNGRDAFTVIARAIAADRSAHTTLCAEWQLVLALAEPEFSLEEQELFAS